MKKETLEETKAQAWIDFARTNKDVDMYSFVIGYDKGAKWQQERSYSEEDMRKAFIAGFTPKITTTLNDSFNKWFKTFKK
jgi:hypothetical protein